MGDNHLSSRSNPASSPPATATRSQGSRLSPVVWLAALSVCAGVFYLTYRQLNSASTQAADPSVSKESAAKESAPKELTAEAIFKQASPAVARIEVRDRASKVIGEGSGFVVSGDGLVATNHHVIEDAASAQVVFADNSKYDVEGVASSLPSSDLVLLKISGQQFPTLALADDTLPPVGNKVYAIGNPKGLTNTLSDGLISGVRPIDDANSLIQTTAAISPGSSGGPLLSQDGKVLGVTTAFIQGGQNLNLVVPVRILKDAINKRGELQSLASASGPSINASKDAKELSDLWAAIDKKDTAKAQKIADELKESKKDSAPYWYAVGLLQTDLGNQEKALDAWKASSKLDPNNASTLFNLGSSYQALDRPADAIQAFGRALVLKPRYTNALNNIALAYIAMADYQQALKVFQSVLARDQNYARAYAGTGLAQLMLQDFEQAAHSLEKAISLDRNDATSHSMLGKARFEQGKNEEALEALHSATRLNPNDAAAFNYMGRSLGRLARYSEAIQAFQSALHLNPNQADSHFYLGLSYHHTKEYAKAAEHWQQAISLDEEGQFGKDSQKYLDAKASGKPVANAQQGFAPRHGSRTPVPHSVFRNLSVGQSQRPAPGNKPRPQPPEHTKSPPPEPNRKR